MGADIPLWSELNYEHLCNGALAVAFDLDGTLAQSKQPMRSDTAQLLSEMTYRFPVAIVSGGRYELVESQILDVIGQSANLRNLHLMPTTGTRYYSWDGVRWRLQYEINIKLEDKRAAYSSIEKHARDMGFWYENVWGKRIEDRGSQITFSALGQQAPLDKKEEWDPTGERRKALAAAIAEDLPHLAVHVGGATSIDISDKGIDKGYAMHMLSSILNVAIDSIIFVGDRMGIEGNDYPAIREGARPVRVTKPDDTRQVMQFILNHTSGNFCIDSLNHRVYKHGLDCNLTPTEYDLFITLYSNANRDLDRDWILERAWGYDSAGDTHMLSTQVQRLRSKIEDEPQAPAYITTVRSVGYRFTL